MAEVPSAPDAQNPAGDFQFRK